MNQKITIVMYHYVRDLEHSLYPEIKGLDAKLFEEQLQYIEKHFQVIRMEDVIKAYEEEDFHSLPENPLLLTFDDGYIDHYTVVYPLLKKYGMQGSFFPSGKAVKEHAVLDVNKIHFILASASSRELTDACFQKMDVYRKNGVDLPSNEALYEQLAVANRWDTKETIFVKRLLQNGLPEHIRNEIATALFKTYVGIKEDVFARQLYMDLNQIQCMKAGGMFFGIHGYDHYWLGKLKEEQMQKDVNQALDFFDGVIDRKKWVMNYPYGNYSQNVIDYVKGKGCVLGVSVEARAVRLNLDNRFILPRFDTNDLPPKSNGYLEEKNA